MPDFLPRLTIGADPEIFLTHNGTPVSAHGLVKGTKREPYKVEKGAVQVDGTALEFNIHPANTVDAFCNNLSSVLASLRSMVPSDYDFDFSPSREYSKNYFDTVPEEAKELGCDPDWNAWTLAPNPRPDASSTLRTIAGHIHVGWLKKPAEPKEHFHDCVEFVKQLDYCLGVPSIILDNGTAAQNRRQLYGKAGAFRANPNYGLEYRVLSPFWLTSQERMRWVFGMCQHAYDLMKSGEILSEKYEDWARSIIDNNDVRAAQLVVEQRNWELPK